MKNYQRGWKDYQQTSIPDWLWAIILISLCLIAVLISGGTYPY